MIEFNHFTIRFEKTFGGTFIGEILRLVLVDLIHQNLLLNGHITNEISTKNYISAADISAFER